MTRNIIVIATLLFIIITGSVYLHPLQAEALNDSEACNAFEGWLSVQDGDLESAQELYDRCHQGSALPEWWDLLLARIHFAREQYQETLEVLHKNRTRFELMYREVHENIEDEEALKEYDRTYYYMVSLNALSHYELGQWREALNDFLLYPAEYQDAEHAEIVAVCYYQIQQYEDALAYFIREYRSRQKDDTGRLVTAYNIGALYARAHQFEDSFAWLNIPLDNERAKWLEKIERDPDFEPIRNERVFEEFLRQQHEKLQQE